VASADDLDGFAEHLHAVQEGQSRCSRAVGESIRLVLLIEQEAVSGKELCLSEDRASAA
jgi:hypothetical protein